MTKEQSMTGLEQAAREHMNSMGAFMWGEHHEDTFVHGFAAGANHVLEEQRKRAGQRFEEWWESEIRSNVDSRKIMSREAWSARQPEIDAKDERLKALEDELLRMWSLKSRTDKEYYAQQGTHPLARQLADQGSKDD